MRIKDPFVSQKQEPVRIRLSTPFVGRKCKHCGEGPTWYWYTRNPTMWVNPRKEMDQFDVYKRFAKFNLDFYLEEEPKYFTRTSAFTYDHHHSYRPRLHRTRGTNPVFDRVEYLSCNCGKTSWAFNQRSGNMKPERKHRRARHNFPNEFID
jgi:hypothetical protein